MKTLDKSRTLVADMLLLVDGGTPPREIGYADGCDEIMTFRLLLLVVQAAIDAEPHIQDTEHGRKLATALQNLDDSFALREIPGSQE